MGDAYAHLQRGGAPVVSETTDDTYEQIRVNVQPAEKRQPQPQSTTTTTVKVMLGLHSALVLVALVVAVVAVVMNQQHISELKGKNNYLEQALHELQATMLSKPGTSPIMSSVPTTISSAAQCPIGFFQLYAGSNCYNIVINDTRDFTGAASACKFEYEGSHTVSLETEQESNAIFERLNSSVYEYWTNGFQPTGVDWRWGHDDVEFSYTAWFHGEPDGGDSEDCAVMRYLTSNDNPLAYWADYKCSREFAFVCEKELSPVREGQ